MGKKRMAKNMLITGATSGIGSYLAHYFAQQGYYLFLHGRNSSKLSKLASALKSDATTYVEADMASIDDIERMFKEITNKTASLNVLVNNAFGKLESPLTKATASELAQFFQISMFGTAEIIRKSVPLLRKGKPAHIINIVADWGFPMHNIMTGPSAYIAGKYGVHGLGAALQTEIAGFGIRTTNICPGVMAADTAFSPDQASDRYDMESIHPRDLAKTIDFVIAQQSSNVRSVVLSPTNPKYNGL